MIHIDKQPEILLIYPPYLAKYKNPPLGLAYLGSYLEKNGYSVKILDMDPLGLNFNDIEKIIKDKKPRIVGVSFMTNQFGNAIKISNIVKKVDPKISFVMGGNHATALPEELLNFSTIDFVIYGEGEISFLKLVDNIYKENIDYTSIKGLAFKDGGKIIINEPSPLIPDLDILPVPLWRDFPVHAYSEMIMGEKSELPAFSVMATRGCPAKCAFCSSHTVFTRTFRNRSPQHILSELLSLKENFGAKHINFVDDTFTINKKVIFEFCELLISWRYNFKWIANARVNSITLELLEIMKEAGCVNINFGVESGDPLVRKNIDKGISSQQIINAHSWAKKVGMIVSTYFMVGNKDEDWKSIEMTINLSKELKSDHPSCSIATPFPDTPMYYEFEKNGWIKVRDWDRYYTTPHLIHDYEPTCITNKMNQKEILSAYYYVNAEFAKIKLVTKYGKNYLFNSKFYKKEIFTRVMQQGVWGFTKLMHKLLKGFFKNVWNLRPIQS